MLLGHARGKVGDLVFSRTNGQQVTRARAAVVKNPQTEAQMIQRILLNTVIQAYSRMSEICDHSFEGVPVGQRSMSVFMRRNLGFLRQYISDAVNIDGLSFNDVFAFAPLGSNEFTMNPFVVSTGSLPSVNLLSVDAFDGASFAVTAADTTLTYGDVITSLGLNRGDQLTFISQQAYSDRRAAFNIARVILDPRDDTGAELPLNTPFLDGTGINAPNPRNEGVDLVYSFANGALTFNASDRSQFGAAVIVSRQRSDGSWLRSNASIVLDSATQALTHSRSLQECLDLFTSGSIDVENPLYLNNARRLTGAATGSDAGFNFNGYVFQNGEHYPTIDSPTQSLTLVSVSQSTMNGGPAVIVTDLEGNRYVLVNNNTYSTAYGLMYANMEGDHATSASGTWRDTPHEGTGDNTTYTGTLPALYMYGFNEDAHINDLVSWLISKGCNAGGFVNP